MTCRSLCVGMYRREIAAQVSLVIAPAVIPTLSQRCQWSHPSSKAASSESKSRKRTTTMNTRSVSRPTSTSASGSKRSSPAISSDTSRKSKKPKVEGEFIADDPMLQCASYALEILSHGGLRSHVIGALVTDDAIELLSLYYDRSIVIASEPLNFIKVHPRFIVFLQAVASLSLQHWGYACLSHHPSLCNSATNTFTRCKCAQTRTSLG
jgi:hypothetical protein